MNKKRRFELVIPLNLKLALAIASEIADISESEFVRQAIYLKLIEETKKYPESPTKKHLDWLLQEIKNNSITDQNN